jgi:hypothetical protein
MRVKEARASLLFWFATFCFATSGQASTIRSDLSWSDYSSLTTGYASTVGMIYGASSSQAWVGSGTVIESNSYGVWVLTAAHVVEDATSLQFVIGGGTYSATSWSYKSYIASDSSNVADAGVGDLGILYIPASTGISGVSPATLYSGTTTSLLGLTATYTGFGNTGTGSTGYQANTYGTLHAVQNVLDVQASATSSGYSSSVLMCDFDSPTHSSRNNSLAAYGSSATPLALEGLIAPGDSGGGVFATVGGVTYLMGVNSFGSASDGILNSDYGDTAGIVSACDFLSWIYDKVATPGDANLDGKVDINDLTVALANYGTSTGAAWAKGDFNLDGKIDINDLTVVLANYNRTFGVSAAGLAAVPEPSSMVLMLGAVGLTALACLRRRGEG